MAQVNFCNGFQFLGLPGSEGDVQSSCAGYSHQFPYQQKRPDQGSKGGAETRIMNGNFTHSMIFRNLSGSFLILSPS